MFIGIYLVSSFLLEGARSGWQENLSPRLYLQPWEGQDYALFQGNTSLSDHFTTLLVDGEHVLLGGRNTVYKLILQDLKVHRSLVWVAGEQDRGVCVVKGKSEESCQNYIKVLKKFDNDSGRYLVCGTNAFKPVCREYVEDTGTYLMTKEFKGIGMCPYSPTHNSTAVLDGDQLYAGTAADYQGVDPILYREPLRTPQFDSTYLNNPNFVGSFGLDDHVYFFFREGGVEYMNCGKAIFSRVARVCKNDLGGTRSLNAKWTSFLKARLNCSVPGHFPFYFDEIQDVTPVIEGIYGEKPGRIVYAVFTTPVNSIGGSAVCAFNMEDINQAFEGLFKEQRSPSDNWLAVEPHKVPSPRPGSCTNNSKELSDANLNFIKTHPLMNEAVPSFFGSPVLIQTGLYTGFTALDVDPQVVTTDGSLFDVVFIGTSSGRLLKCVNSMAPKSTASARPVLIEEIEAMSGPIKKVKVVSTKKGAGHVLVVSSEEVRSFPLFRCEKAASCTQCIALQDPYCAWDVRGEICRGAQSWAKGSQKSYLQAIAGGQHAGCPKTDPPPPSSSGVGGRSKLSSAGTVVNQIHPDMKSEKSERSDKEDHRRRELNLPDRQAAPVLFTLETLIITVSAGAVAALVLGFVSGYCCGRKCGKEESNVPYTEYEYFEQRQLPPRPLPALQPLLQQVELKQPPQQHQQAEETLYAEPILVNQSKPNPLGTSLAHKPYPSSGMTMMMVGAGPPGGPINTQNKFNTISNIHKRGAGGGHYGVGRGPFPSDDLKEGGGQPNHYERGRGPLLPPTPAGIYHMGTLSRASKNNMEGSQLQQQQVVDSAYGTTRSVKKVYL